MENAVIIAEPLTHTPPQRAPQSVLIDQIDKEFVKVVTIIQKGDSINFPNKDDIRHHVYSFSAPREFELPLYEGTPAEPITFDKPGVVKLGCNIHDWMYAYLYIAETPYTAISGKDGKASLADLPDGSYEIRIWHPLMREGEQSTVQKLEFNAGSADAVTSWEIKLKPDFRPRRAPMPVNQGY